MALFHMGDDSTRYALACCVGKPWACSKYVVRFSDIYDAIL